MLEAYPFTLIDDNYKVDEPCASRKKASLFRFKSITRSSSVHYFVLVEHYENDVLVVKYYPKNIRQSPYRYQIITDTKDVIRIVKTVTAISLHMLERCPRSSFAFIGMPSVQWEDGRWVNEVVHPSQRFKIYEWYMRRMPEAHDFVHRTWPEANAYLLLNKCYSEEDIPVMETIIMDMFLDAYDNILDPRIPSNPGSAVVG